MFYSTRTRGMKVMEMCLRRVWEIVGTETWDKLGELEAET